MKKPSSGLSRLVKEKTHYSLKTYCELRGLSFLSIYAGFISQKAARALAKDGIVIAPTKPSPHTRKAS